MREFFFEGIKRLDWGFGNPNITAGLIASLMMAVWTVAWIHRWGFWPALAAFTALGVCLMQTVSRGGVVAVIAGGVILAASAKRPWRKPQWIAMAVCIVGLAGYAIWLGTGARYSQGIVEKDGSITNRWIIYRSVPRMIVDAPGGWGLKRAQEAFHNFYQPEGRIERYGSLVSSHLTWLAEFSWLGRVGYLFGWMTVLYLCWPSRRAQWYSVALAIWVAYGVAAAFSPMANRWILWITPGVLLLAVLTGRVIRKDWPPPRSWAIPLAGTAGAVFSLCLWGWFFPQPSPIKLSKGIVSVGKTTTGRTVWLAAPEKEILGQAFAQQIRESLRESSSGPAAQSFAIEWNSTNLSPDAEDVVTAMGEGIKDFDSERLENLRNAAQWIFLNPGEPSKELFESLDQMPRIRVIWGEFNPSQNRLIWQALANRFENVSFETAEAAGRYLPNWMDYLTVDPSEKENPENNEALDADAGANDSVP